MGRLLPRDSNNRKGITMTTEEIIKALADYLPTVEGQDIYAPLAFAIHLLLTHAVDEDHPIHKELGARQ